MWCSNASGLLNSYVLGPSRPTLRPCPLSLLLLHFSPQLREQGLRSFKAEELDPSRRRHRTQRDYSSSFYANPFGYLVLRSPEFQVRFTLAH